MHLTEYYENLLFNDDVWELNMRIMKLIKYMVEIERTDCLLKVEFFGISIVQF